jgi:hypothetical protein
VGFNDRAIGSKSGRENTEHHRLRDWIVEWVLKQLAPYHGKPDDEIQEAAALGKFRYLARRCVLALRKKIVRSYPKDRIFHRACVSLDQSYITDDEDDARLVDVLVGPPLVPKDLLQVVDDSRADLEHICDFNVVRELIVGYIDGVKKGETTRRVAIRLGVGERQARNIIKRCHQALAAANAFKQIHDVLNQAGDPLTHAHAQLLEQSPEAKRRGRFKNALLSQAAQGMAEFRAWAGNDVVDAVLAEENEAQRNDASNRLQDEKDGYKPSLMDAVYREAIREQLASECDPEIDGPLPKEEPEEMYEADEEYLEE